MTDIEHIRNTALPETDKALKELVRLSGSLEKIHQKLNDITLAIAEHYQQGNLHDEERNHVLWHDLHNVQHQLKQFTQYAKESVEDFAKTSLALAEALAALRPPRDE